MYKTLNDASHLAKELSTGTTKVWYCKDSRNAFFGVNELERIAGHRIDKANISDTHALVGEISSVDLEDIFYVMQGEVWSPNGEARDLIRSLGLDHTSMSVGDAIQIGDAIHFVGSIGFEER